MYILSLKIMLSFSNIVTYTNSWEI